MPSTYEPIATNTVSGSVTTLVSFQSISGSYTDLILVASIKGDNASTGVSLTVNGDTGSNYSSTYLEGNGSTAVSSRLSSQTKIFLSSSVSFNSTNFGVQLIHFMSYSNTTTNKTILQRFNSNGGSFPGVGASVGLWRSTAAINRIDISAASGTAYAADTTFTLYGIKAA